jgi:hypothetical protein
VIFRFPWVKMLFASILLATFAFGLLATRGFHVADARETALEECAQSQEHVVILNVNAPEVTLEGETSTNGDVGYPYAVRNCQRVLPRRR